MHYLCSHLRERATTVQKHSQVILHQLGYWIIHLVLAAIHSTSAHFSSGLVVVFLALSSFIVANSETYLPVIFHASVLFPAIICHTITRLIPSHHTSPTCLLFNVVKTIFSDILHHTFPYVHWVLLSRQCGILPFRIMLFRLMLYSTV